ncbi:MAG TPA: hypothetical protein VF844_12940, partial [Ktedonobacteraceae bacterium]
MDISDQLNATHVTLDEVEPFLELTPALVQKRRSQGRIIFDRFLRNRAAICGAVFLILLFVFCFFGPVAWQIDPNQNDVTSVAATLAPPSLAHPLGTDDVGRDTLARAMAGGRVSLSVGLLSMLMAIVFGIGIGAFAGF